MEVRQGSPGQTRTKINHFNINNLRMASGPVPAQLLCQSLRGSLNLICKMFGDRCLCNGMHLHWRTFTPDAPLNLTMATVGSDEPLMVEV
jgi:hypothetical protein